MFRSVSLAGGRVRVATTRIMTRWGFQEDTFVLILSFAVGVVTAAAAVAFHLLIDLIRRYLYGHIGPGLDMYGRMLPLLVLFPTLGGLVVGLLVNYVVRAREGHGIIDVMEQVIRSRGVIRPTVAVEKILTSAVTIGTGGSAGAEGPIVQIGAAIASGIGQLFRVTRQQMPILIGCGSAAGISAIFNAPIGGVLFTLEIILRDFSIRTFTPVVIASVVANFTTQSIFRDLLGEEYGAIFTLPPDVQEHLNYQFHHLPSFILLGLICGVVGVALTRLMYLTEHYAAHVRIPRALKPAAGGLLLGLLGVFYILTFHKVIPFEHYPMPAFFGDGYGAVKQMLGPAFYTTYAPWKLLLILAFFLVAKTVGTCLTLGSGGAGGVIAPSLFLGAVAGGFVGVALQSVGLSKSLSPHAYALVGVGSVLGAVVHAPLASILILSEVTRDYQIVLPAMLSAIVATTTAQLIFRDSIYTATLRQRGVRLGTSADVHLLQRLSVEECRLEPAIAVRAGDTMQSVLDLSHETDATDFIIVDGQGGYAGMLVGEDIKTALFDRDAVPLLLVGELLRPEIPAVRVGDDLASVLDTFAKYDVARLPVTVTAGSGKVIGLISRAALMKRYQAALAE
jgi:CIC family chloride channel protein